MKIRYGIGRAFGGVALAALFALTYAGCAGAPVDDGAGVDPVGAPDEALGVATEALGVCDVHTKFQALHQAGRCPMPGAPFCEQFCASSGCGVKYDYLSCQDLPIWGKPAHIELSYTEYCGCGPNTCDDGIQNQGETGVDCGGSCPACPSCSDVVMNQGETGIDCGGPCAPCASCNDGIHDQGETGVDCGGPCVPCGSCNDGLQNQGETGLDCGGVHCQPCLGCPVDEPLAGTPCAIVGWCQYGFNACTGAFIEVSGHGCFDGIWNDGVEVEPRQPVCCASDADCDGTQCASGVCLGPTCANGIEDDIEAGVDCGGDCPPCPP